MPPTEQGIANRKFREAAELAIEGIALALPMKCSMDWKIRAVGDDDYFLTEFVHLDNEAEVAGAAEAIAKQADNKPVIFSRLYLPNAVDYAANLHDSKQAVVASAVKAYDPIAAKRQELVGFLFKVA